MALRRGGFRRDRIVVLFTMTNAATEVARAINYAAINEERGQLPSAER
jgi:hypothetical protein